MEEPVETLMISALQHYAYCPRQFALIHVEQAWSENYFTAQGQQLHTRVDSREPEQRGNVRFERSVAVHSEILGLSGKLDLLEIESHPKRYCPVEYKRGKPKAENWDRIQLCAQALCLEEMREIEIHEGALWYWQTRKRQTVTIDSALRQRTLKVINEARAMLSTGLTPPPLKDRKQCHACSLADLCQPDVFDRDHTHRYVQELFGE